MYSARFLKLSILLKDRLNKNCTIWKFLTQMASHKLYTIHCHPMGVFHLVNNGNRNMVHRSHQHRGICSFAVSERVFLLVWEIVCGKNYKWKLLVLPSRVCQRVQFHCSCQFSDEDRRKRYFPDWKISPFPNSPNNVPSNGRIKFSRLNSFCLVFDIDCFFYQTSIQSLWRPTLWLKRLFQMEHHRNHEVDDKLAKITNSRPAFPTTMQQSTKLFRIFWKYWMWPLNLTESLAHICVAYNEPASHFSRFLRFSTHFRTEWNQYIKLHPKLKWK